MRTRLLPLFLLPLSLPLPSALHAQAATSTPGKPDYAGESFVIERSTYRDTFAADGTGTRQHTLAIRIQSEAALRELSVLAIPFASASEKVEILYARSRHPDGTVTETPTAAALEQPEPVTTQAPFYSDLKEKQLPIKGLRVGDTFEWQALITRFKPEAPSATGSPNFWGQEQFVNAGICLSETVELRVPKATHLTLYTNPKLKLSPTESDEGSEHIYRWQHASLDPTTGPVAEAAKALKKKTLLTPEEELEAREGQLPSVAWTTFPSWAAVGEWYRSLESGRTTPDAQIKAKVAELTATPAGKPPLTEEEKVRAVYSFVAPQIRYIGVAFGVGRYQPHHAEEILDNQYGDCKDKHTLLAAMLQVLGLHPEAVLIGQGIRFNPALPSPMSFNHLITRVAVDGKPIWLDATAEVAPYRVLSYDLRDKQALVVPEPAVPEPAVPEPAVPEPAVPHTAPATIERTPKDLPFPAIDSMTSVATVNKDGVSDSHIRFTMRSDSELVFRTIVRQITPAQYGEFVQQVSRNIGYSGTTSHPELGRPEDTAGPYILSYDYHRELSAKDWADHQLVAQFAPVNLPVLDEKEPPFAPILLGAPVTSISSAQLKIPDHWTAQLPEAIHQKPLMSPKTSPTGWTRAPSTRNVRSSSSRPMSPPRTGRLTKSSQTPSAREWKTTSSLNHRPVRKQRSPPRQSLHRKPLTFIGKAYAAMQSHDLDKAKAFLDQAKNSIQPSRISGATTPPSPMIAATPSMPSQTTKRSSPCTRSQPGSTRLSPALS